MTDEWTDLVRLDRLGPALARATGDDAWLELRTELISGGKSNLTFTLTSTAGELILRRPPTGDLLPSAHDMGREARVQQRLAGTDVPVARVVLYDDGDLLGIQCYVMEKVPGHVVRGELPDGYAGPPAERQRMAYAFVDTLAHLHAVDHDAVGLGDYGRPDGFIERQVRRWTSQWGSTRTEWIPEVDELGRRLAARVPAQRRSAIVHGDFRLDNVVFDLQNPGRINAILDWELSTLGEPLADVGLLMLFWRGAEDAQLSLIPGISHLPGFPSRDAMVERYAATSRVDLTDVDFYLAFAHFKFAVIAQGVQVRAKAGAMAGQQFGDLDEEIRHLGRSGLELV